MDTYTKPDESKQLYNTIFNIKNKKINATPIETDQKCYYCGSTAYFFFSSSKRYCCANVHTKCPIQKQKLSENSKNVIKSVSIITSEICDYGCGEVAKFQFGINKKCCQSHPTKCPHKKQQIAKNNVYTSINVDNYLNALCSHGCGNSARFRSKTGHLCCSPHHMKCPVNKKQSVNTRKTNNIQAEPVCSEHNCRYCGTTANFYFTKTKTYCCSNNHMKCPAVKNAFSKNPDMIVCGTPISTTDLCDYNCGLTANFQFKNGKKCCSRNTTGCPTIRKKRSDFGKTRDYSLELERNKKISIANKGRVRSDQCRRLISLKNTGKKRSIEDRWKISERTTGKNNPNYGKTHSPETRRKISIANKGRVLSTKSRKKLISINKTTGMFYSHRYAHYNEEAISIIKSYGRKYGLCFRHGETRTIDGVLLGEYWLQELDYYLDAIDMKNKVILEIDEPYHYKCGKLKPADVQRQINIMKYFPNFKFIRLKLSKNQYNAMKGRSHVFMLP